MSCSSCGNAEIMGILQELRTELRVVRTDCQRIKREILGISNEAEEAGDGLMETTTVRQVMERMAHDIETLQIAVQEPAPPEADEDPGGADALPNEAPNVEHQRPEEPPVAVVDIVAVNMAEEYELVRAELGKIKAGGGIQNGASLQGETVAGILEYSEDWSVTVKISNYLNLSLVDGKHFPARGNKGSDSEIMFVAGRTREVFTLDSDYNNGQLSFRVGQSNISLYVLFHAPRRNCADLRVAFVPADLDVDRESFSNFKEEGEDYSLFREDFKACKWNGKGGEFFIKSGNFRARARLLRPTDRKFLLSIDIGSIEGVPGVFTSPDLISAQVLDSALLNYGDVTSMLATLTGNFAALIRISNRLNSTLEDPFVYLRGGAFDRLLQPIEPSKHKVLKINFNSKPVKGVVTYRMSNTDLRLAIAFNIKPNGNTFVIGFSPLATPTDRDMLDSLYEEDFWSWSSRTDQKMTKALDGPQTIYRRNIVVRAKMSSDPRALLDVVVASF